MTRPRPRIGSELLPLFLILLCLGGTLALVIATHRRGVAARRQPEEPKVAAAPAPPPVVEDKGDPDPPPAPAPLVEDPTKKALAQLSSAEQTEREEARNADRRAESLEIARRDALAKSERWRRRESVVLAQVAELAEQADRTRMELESIEIERDALARERDAAKAALAKARSASSYAILPHKGPNGTWRRPIVVECRNGAAILQPAGAAFGMLELSGLGGLRSSPFVRAVARELVRISGQSGPDGAANVPYIFFVIRPDGIRPYYEARGRLEMLGIAFGYELVDQDWEIDFSDLENPVGTDPLSPGPSSRPPAVAEREELTWPGERPSAKRDGGEAADSFVWHSRPTGMPNGNGGSRRADDRPAGGSSADPADRAFTGGVSRLPAGGRGTGTGRASEPDRGSIRGSGNPSGGTNNVTFGTPGVAPSVPAEAGSDPGSSLGMAGGQSATERAFGTPGNLSPVGPEGLPAFQPAEGLGGSGGRNGSGAGNVAQNGGARPFSGLARGRAGGGANAVGGAQGPMGLAAVDEDEPPQDGRVPVVPRGYFDQEDDENDQAQNAKQAANGASRGSGGSSGSTGSSSDSNEVGPDSSSSSSGSPGSSAGASGSVAALGSAGSAGGPKSRKGSILGDKPPLRIEVPFEMTVVCSRSGVIIHPGGYRLSPNSLKSKDQMLIKELKAVLQQRREVDPLIVPQPRLKFLIETGGAQSYEDARKQTALAGVAWPTTIQVGDTSVISFSGRGTTR